MNSKFINSGLVGHSIVKVENVMLLNTFHYFQLFICVAFIELDLPDIVMDIA